MSKKKKGIKKTKTSNIVHAAPAAEKLQMKKLIKRLKLNIIIIITIRQSKES